ncbi:MAG: 6,7-dimethyl-8-ribityllumazine synthase [Alphaproteobacteria bacterium]|nr:6,7-dimethyl-8-ribityllumazine synthase [Alphaproteobacteria bacterium]
MPQKNIGVITGSFHKEEANVMVSEVRKVADDINLNIVSEVWVPGSMEVPLALKKMLLNDNYDGAVVLGIIEKGETLHGQVMGQAVAKSIIELQLETMKPVGFGILGPGIEPHQIPARVVNYARDAALALRESFNYLEKL